VKYFIPKPKEISVNSTQNENNNSINKSINKPNIEPKSDKKFVCNYKNCTNSYYNISGLYNHKKTIHKSNNKSSKVVKKVNMKSYQSTGQPAPTTAETVSPGDNSECKPRIVVSRCIRATPPQLGDNSSTASYHWRPGDTQAH